MTNSNQVSFENAIGSEDSYWLEYSLDAASEILSLFQADDWQWLLNSVLTKPKYWQERCAEACGDLEGDNAAQVLILLLNSESFVVSAISVSQLDNMEVKLNKGFEGRLEEILRYLTVENSPRQQDVLRLLAGLAK